jgi:hypothetical protein
MDDLQPLSRMLMVFGPVPEILLENDGERLGNLFRSRDAHVLSVDVVQSGGRRVGARVTLASAEGARNAKELFDARPFDISAVVPQGTLSTRVEFEILWALRTPILLLSDLSPETDSADLRMGLSQFGEIDELEMLTSETARVRFKSRRAAARVLKLFSRNLFMVCGYPVPVRATVAPGTLFDEQLCGAAAFLCLNASDESGGEVFIAGTSDSVPMRFPGVPKLTPHFAQAFSEEFDAALKFRKLQQVELAERRSLEQHQLKRRVNMLRERRESFVNLKGMVEMLENLKKKILSYGDKKIAENDRNVALSALNIDRGGGGGGGRYGGGSGGGGGAGGGFSVR